MLRRLGLPHFRQDEYVTRPHGGLGQFTEEKSMSKLGTLVLGGLVGGAGVFGALNYHVLRTADGYEFIPKASATFDDTYVDVRAFGVSDWVDHADLSKAVVKADKQHLIKDSSVNSVLNGLSNMVDGIRK
jgi:hypothetical protein